MKREFFAALLACLMIWGTAWADGGISVYIDGAEVEFSVPPYLAHDRTMVPMRRIFEELDCEVEWNEPTQGINALRGETEIYMEIGNPVMVVSGSRITLDAPPELTEDTTFVPLRAVSEALGCAVGWNEAESRADILSASAMPGGAPDFSAIIGREPDFVSSDPEAYFYSGVSGDMAQAYRNALLGAGFMEFGAGDYSVYTKGDISVLAGLSGDVYRIVITDY